MRFHQLGACERECFCLAGIVTYRRRFKTRAQELIETLAAGKYPILLSNFISGTGSSGAVAQALIFGTK